MLGKFAFQLEVLAALLALRQLGHFHESGVVAQRVCVDVHERVAADPELPLVVGSGFPEQVKLLRVAARCTLGELPEQKLPRAIGTHHDEHQRILGRLGEKALGLLQFLVGDHAKS